MQVIKCWDIQVWDGGNGHDHKYYVATEEAANAWKKAHKHDYIQEREFVILANLDEVEEFETGELRRKALAKLTEAEKRALGLK